MPESIARHGRLRRRIECRRVQGSRDSHKKSINKTTARMCASGGSIA
jgi:hypothetical protein